MPQRIKNMLTKYFCRHTIKNRIVILIRGRCILKISLITNGSDDSMDCNTTDTIHDTPINKYEIKCALCNFPDIDKTPEPYYIRKRFTYSNIEIFKANLGDLLLSERLKTIFSILFQGQLEFKPVYIENTSIKTKWWLGIVKNFVVTGEIKDEVPRCRLCLEPLHWHPGSQSKYRLEDLESDFDIVKGKNWHSLDEKDWKKSWIKRDAFFSKRLIELLKKLKAKGIYQYAFSPIKKASKEDKEWIQHTYNALPSDLKVPITLSFDENKKSLLIQKIKDFGIFSEKQHENKSIKIKYEHEIIALLKKLDKPLQLTYDPDYSVDILENWECYYDISDIKRARFINFAFDQYGNYYSFDKNNKDFPVYHFNHEAFVLEQIYNSIYEFFDVLL